MMLLIFTSLAVGTYSSIILVDNAGPIAALRETLQEAVRTRDERFRSLDERMKTMRERLTIRTSDRYHAHDAAADFAARDEQINLLWRHIQKLERRR